LARHTLRHLTRLAWAAALSICSAALLRAQTADAPTAYVERGQQTEARQRVLHDRMDRLHAAIAEELRRAAPDLLPRRMLEMAEATRNVDTAAAARARLAWK